MKVDEFLEKYFTDDARPTKYTVWRWIRAGKLSAHRTGRHYYIQQGDAEQFLRIKTSR
jgi:excisionase family DNA binding protein